VQLPRLTDQGVTRTPNDPPWLVPAAKSTVKAPFPRSELLLLANRRDEPIGQRIPERNRHNNTAYGGEERFA